jgi:hypothetical protein
MIPTGIPPLDARLSGGAETGIHVLATPDGGLARFACLNLAYAAAMQGQAVLYLVAKAAIPTVQMQLRLLTANIPQPLLERSASDWSPDECRRLGLSCPNTHPTNLVQITAVGADVNDVHTAVTNWQRAAQLYKREARLVIVESIDELAVRATPHMTQPEIKSKILKDLDTYATDTDVVVWATTATKVAADGSNTIPLELTCDGSTDVLIGVAAGDQDAVKSYLPVTLTSLSTDSAGAELALWLSPTGRLWANCDSAVFYDRINGSQA